MNILRAIEQELAVVVRPLYFTAVHYQERTEWWFHETLMSLTFDAGYIVIWQERNNYALN